MVDIDPGYQRSSNKPCGLIEGRWKKIFKNNL